MAIRSIVALLFLACSPALLADDTLVTFDVPSSIECRDRTPSDFALANPALKVIEAKFRISARIIADGPTDVVDFMYELTSPDRTLKVQDYLPNTTLESAVADDQIEINNAAEKAHTTGIDARVVYKMFTVGGTHSQSGKKSEATHYKQIASKDLVLASGTTDREYGVFFRIRPSRSAALEGAREFTILAVVPKTWRGDRAVVTCTARARKSSLLTSSIVTAGSQRAEIGLYLSGDAEAAATAEELRFALERRALLASQRGGKENVFSALSNQATALFVSKRSDHQDKVLAAAQATVRDVEHRLRELAR
jgi:hypothetical protein